MKRIIPYILILIVIVGLFSPVLNVSAQGNNTPPPTTPPTTPPATPATPPEKDVCIGLNSLQPAYAANGCTSERASPTTAKTAFENAIDTNYSCASLANGTFTGCIIQLFYFLFYTIPKFLLSLTAQLFDFLVAITLSSSLYTKSKFLPEAWAIIRDISNIFFILILLYISIRVILGLGGHEVKKMIGRVIVMALLINFSMFFTGVIIDASNILALVFYNKINVEVKDAKETTPFLRTISLEKTGIGQKDIAGGLAKAFNPTYLLSDDFFDQLEKRTVIVRGSPGVTLGTLGAGAAAAIWVPVIGQVAAVGAAVYYFVPHHAEKIPPGLLMSVILVSGLVMIFAIYAFFVAGLSFLGRLMGLWLSIIVSPFAFMSSSVPFLDHIESIGWASWLKKLISTAFMAPVFMFFLYVIFKLINAKIFENLLSRTDIAKQGTIETMIIIIVETVLILGMLLKAANYAKKASGEFGELIFKGAKAVGGVAVGAGFGGAALLGTGLIGGGLNKFMGSKLGERFKNKTEEKGLTGWAARTALKAGNYGTKATFDVRKSGLGGLLSKGTGMDFQSASLIGLGSKEGGLKGAQKRYAESLKEESELFKTNLSTPAEVEAFSDERQARYDAKDDNYKKTHVRPAKVGTVDQLNGERLRAFQDQLGLEGLLGAVAYSTLRKTGQLVNGTNYQNDDDYKENKTEYDKKYADKKYDSNRGELIANDINKKAAGRVKMAIGATLAVGGGGLAGGLVGMPVTGAVLGGAGAGSKKLREDAGESKFSSGLDKELKKLEDIQKTIDRMEELFKKQTKVFDDAKKFEIPNRDGTKTETNLITKDKDEKEVVDEERLAEALAKMTFAAQDIKIRMKELNRTIEKKQGGLATDTQNRKKDEMQREMIQVTMATEKLKALQGIEEKKTKTETDLYNLRGKKTEIKDGSSGGGSAPAAASAPAKH